MASSASGAPRRRRREFLFHQKGANYEATQIDGSKSAQSATAQQVGGAMRTQLDKVFLASYLDRDTWGDTGAIEEFFTDEAKGHLKDDVGVLTLGENASDTYTYVQPERSTVSAKVLTDNHGNALRALSEVNFVAVATHKDGTYSKITVTGAFFFVKDGNTWKIEGYRLNEDREADQGSLADTHPHPHLGGLVIRRLLAVFLVLSAWLAGTALGSIGVTPHAAGAPLLEIGRAHADFGPTLDGTKPIFVLVLGSDARPGTPMDHGLSDSIHILGINPAAHRATLYGIPRDSYVPLATGGTDKINAAMPPGGVPGELQTVENLTGIKFDYWILTGFVDFARAVNDIGGLVVNVPYSMQGDAGHYDAGPQRMSGGEALAFARTRHFLPLGDFNRLDEPGLRDDQRPHAVPRGVREGPDQPLHVARRRDPQHDDDAAARRAGAAGQPRDVDPVEERDEPRRPGHDRDGRLPERGPPQRLEHRDVAEAGGHRIPAAGADPAGLPAQHPRSRSGSELRRSTNTT